MASGDVERRNKGKDKRKRNKNFPYHKGGARRSANDSKKKS